MSEACDVTIANGHVQRCQRQFSPQMLRHRRPAVLNADESQLQEPAGQGLVTPGWRLALAN
jgi:hypothetical protein